MEDLRAQRMQLRLQLLREVLEQARSLRTSGAPENALLCLARVSLCDLPAKDLAADFCLEQAACHQHMVDNSG